MFYTHIFKHWSSLFIYSSSFIRKNRLAVSKVIFCLTLFNEIALFSDFKKECKLMAKTK